jgi:hemoglobin
MANTLFDELGGTPTLERVHKIFYDKLLRDPWLKQFFAGVPQAHLENQQTSFLAGVFGGPRLYGGRPIDTAHEHMFITEDVFLARHQVLADSLIQAGVAKDLRERWLDYNMKTKKALVKQSVSECKGRYKTEPIIVVERPRELA